MRAVAIIKKTSDYFELLSAIKELHLHEVKLFFFPNMKHHVNMKPFEERPEFKKGKVLLFDIINSDFVAFPFLFGFRAVAYFLLSRLMFKSTINLSDGIMEDYDKNECLKAMFKSTIINRIVLKLMTSGRYSSDYAFSWSGKNVFANKTFKINPSNLHLSLTDFNLNVIDFGLELPGNYSLELPSSGRYGLKLRGKNLFIDGLEVNGTKDLTAEEIIFGNTTELVVLTPLSTILSSALTSKNVTEILVDCKSAGKIQKRLPNTFQLALKESKRIRQIG